MLLTSQSTIKVNFSELKIYPLALNGPSVPMELLGKRRGLRLYGAIFASFLPIPLLKWNFEP